MICLTLNFMASNDAKDFNKLFKLRRKKIKHLKIIS
jgi:hypothetical protein